MFNLLTKSGVLAFLAKQLINQIDLEKILGSEIVANNKLLSIANNLHSNAKTNLQINVLNKANDMSNVISNIITKIVLGVVLLLFFSFLNVSLALVIGDMLGKMYLGFLIISSMYLILFVALYFTLFRKVKNEIGKAVSSFLD